MSPDDRFKRIIEEGQCIGCGLCASIYPDKLSISKTESGYLRPAIVQPLKQEEVGAIYRVCPGVVVSGLVPVAGAGHERVAATRARDELWVARGQGLPGGARPSPWLTRKRAKEASEVKTEGRRQEGGDSIRAD